MTKRKRDFIPRKTRDGAEVSLRKPTLSQERERKKKRRLAPFEMTVWCGQPENKEGTMFRLLPGIFDIVPRRNQEHSQEWLCYLDQGGVTPDMRA
jgi:hypothetical protein